MHGLSLITDMKYSVFLFFDSNVLTDILSHTDVKLTSDLDVKSTLVVKFAVFVLSSTVSGSSPAPDECHGQFPSYLLK